MTIDINQFWSLLAESKIASPSQIQRVFSEFSADSSVARQAPALAQWLTDKGLISSYQASILTAGHAGPFSYGQYRVSSRFEDGPLKGCFSAKHSGSGTKVVLHFAEGATADDLQRWGQIEAQAGRLAGIHSGLVVPVYETVVLNEHRFVVSEFPRGKSVMQLPGKSRLPWKQACFVGAQIAYGLSAIHDQGFRHGALSPASVWIDSSGRAQLYPGCGSLSVPWNYFKQLPEELLECVYDCLAPEVDQPDQR